MGVDACIYFKTRNGDEPTLCDELPSECSIVKAEKRACEDATHKVDQLWRYYGPGYERGPWPRIAAVLMALHASPDVETVWYFGDCCDGDEPFTQHRVHELSAHYMAEGDRPYRGRFSSWVGCGPQ
jgi:hypothetical protein